MTFEQVLAFLETATQEDLFEIAFSAADEFNARGSLTNLNVVLEQRKF